MGNSMLDIRNLLWHTVSKWRTVVIAAVVGAVVAGGIGAVISIEPEVDVNVEATQAQIDTLNAEIAELTDAQTQLNQYMSESRYMQLDYMSIVKTVFVINIKPTNTESVNADIQISELVNLYNNSVNSDALYQQISDAHGYSMNYTEQMFTTEADGNGGFITFILQSNGQTENEAVGDIIVTYLSEIYSEFNTNTYEHTLSTGIFNTTRIVGEEINNNNTEKEEELDTVNADISWRQGEIATLQALIDDQGFTRSMAIDIMIYMILGFILGALLALAYIVVKPFSVNQLQGENYIEKAQDVNVLATSPLLSTSKNIIDNLIYRIGCRGALRTEEAFLEYLTLSMNVHTVSGETIHLTGTIGAETIADLTAKIQDKIHAELTIGGAVTEEVSSLEELCKTQKVILVEKRFCTRREDLEREIQYIKKLDKEIKGIILL